MWWAEFDGAHYNCMPDHDLGNVLTPVKLLENARDLHVRYPPPSPPPPQMPAPPLPPPPPPQQCMNSELPQADSTSEALAGGCWRWFENNGKIQWPPIESHRDVLVQDPSCPDDTSFTNAINRDTFYMFNPSSHLRSSVERLAPTGAPYPDCGGASDQECCIAQHQVRVPASADGNGLLSTRSGCQERCNIERRVGFESSCLPGVPNVWTPKTIHPNGDGLVFSRRALASAGGDLTSDDCRTYAESRNFAFQVTSSLDYRPPGCFVKETLQEVVFNPTGTRLNNDCTSSYACVCKLVNPEQRFVDTLCMCGSRFTDDQDNSASAVAMGASSGGFLFAESATASSQIYTVPGLVPSPAVG